MAGIYFDYVIVGASRAGVSCIEGIRSRDPSGTILLISREGSFPYKRTKLSKELHNSYGNEDFLLHPSQWYEEQKITVYLGAEAVDLAPQIYTLFLADGRKIAYGQLCIASGASPLELPAQLPIRYLREKNEGQKLFTDARTWNRVCIVGNGIQGVELAEQFRLMGKEVDLTGQDPRPMASRVDPDLSRMIQESLVHRGINVHNQHSLSAASDCTKWDGIVASVGISPATAWIRDSGLQTKNGIVIDTCCRTSEPEIFAAGDIAEPIYPFTAGLWHNAEYQGFTAGLNMAGKKTQLEHKPFRVKLDLFDQHYYALWYNQELETDPDVSSVRLNEAPDMEYCRLFYRGNSFAAALYCGDPSIGKKIITPLAAQGIPFDRLLEEIKKRQVLRPIQ